jgi:hypothetical protein
MVNWVRKALSLFRSSARARISSGAAWLSRWSRAKNPNPALLLFNFVNPPPGDRRYLRELDVERERLERLWRGRDPWRAGNTRFQCNVTPDDVVELLSRGKERDNICVFHFAGHANSNLLELSPPQDASNSSASAHAVGLAALLGRLSSLRLVFLNGCSTLAQAEELGRQGVSAVIVTTGDIADNAAALFSAEFYANLLSADSLRTAFEKAAEAVRTFLSEDQIVRRGQNSGTARGDLDLPETPWHLEGNADALSWKLGNATGEAQRERRRTRAKWGVLGILILITLCAPYFVYRAYVERQLSFAQELAETARRLPTDEHNTPVALALAAVTIDKGRGRLESLIDALLRSDSPGPNVADRIFIKTETGRGILRDLAWAPPKEGDWGFRVAIADDVPGVALIAFSESGLVAPSAYLNDRIAKKIGPCLAVAWHPQKPNVIAAASEDGSIWLVNTNETTAEPRQIIPSMKPSPPANKVPPNRLVTAYVMHDPLRDVRKADYKPVFEALAWKPDGSELLCAGRFRPSILWRENGSSEVVGELLYAWGAAWSSDGTQFFLAGQTNDGSFNPGEIQIWNTPPLKQVYKIAGRRGVVLNIAVNPADPGRFACVYDSAGAEVWHTGRAEPEKRLYDAWRNPSAMGNHVRGVTWHSGGEMVATAGLEGVVRLWNSRSGRCLCALDPPRYYDMQGSIGYTKLTWSPHGAWLAAATTKGEVWFWNVSLARWHATAADLNPQPPNAAEWLAIFGSKIPFRKLSWENPYKRPMIW